MTPLIWLSTPMVGGHSEGHHVLSPQSYLPYRSDYHKNSHDISKEAYGNYVIQYMI